MKSTINILIMDYFFHKGCCETAENWMDAIGINSFWTKELDCFNNYKTYEELLGKQRELCKD